MFGQIDRIILDTPYTLAVVASERARRPASFPKEAPESTVEASLELLEQIKHYQSSCARAQALSDECEKLKTEILNYMGFAEKLTHNGKTIATWKCSKASSRVDSKALAQAYPDIAKSFTSQVLGSRRFLLKEAA